MTKRRLISLLPSVHQTTDLQNFFGTTVDELFQPGTSEALSGYIGHVLSFSTAFTRAITADAVIGSRVLSLTTTLDIVIGQAVSGPGIPAGTVVSGISSTSITLSAPITAMIPMGTAITLDAPVTDFYIGEPSVSRSVYQLEPGMVSGTYSLTYPDLIGYLATAGGNVSDHQRLFETEYYSWAPPINIDMLVNYRQYYWFGDASGADDLPTLTLNVPVASYTGNAFTNTFPLPTAIAAVPPNAERVSVFVDGTSISFSLDGDAAVINPPPDNGAVIQVVRTPDLAEAITGATMVDVSDINDAGVSTLSTGMRINIIDFSSPSGNVYMVDGVGRSLRLTPDSAIIRDTVPQYITIDRSSVDGNLWSLHNSWVHRDSFSWAGLNFPARQATRPILEFVRDIVLYAPQIWSESVEPLFALYDLNNLPLDDPGAHPQSNFVGSRIFAFATGDTPTDPVLLKSLNFDQNGYIVFQNEAVSGAYSDRNGPITSLYSYATQDAPSIKSYHSLWHIAPAPTTQGVENGFYDVPHNLSANPTSEDVSTISRSTWTKHFTSLLANQNDLTGDILGSNNYRDTVQDLSLGTSILQHRCPLLKLMLLASVSNFDIPAALHYADQEYNRFRNKFARKLEDLRNRGVLLDSDAPSRWLTTALNDLRRGKTSKSPFALNNIAGSQYFIPPTPAALGVLPVATPKMVTDTTYPTPVLMIQGHDGSLTPAYGDWRDAIMLAFEQAIYDSLPSQFKSDTRPDFDIQQWIGGTFYAPADGYDRDEVAAILAPSFELWAQINRFDYRSNAAYDIGDPFTWNYRGIIDRRGNSLPGGWRAIYRSYFDTDAPHSRPWEMLGFVDQPSWWQAKYGAGPYSRDHHMWTDLEMGRIVDGTRAGIDDRYARPGLHDLLPIDQDGALLDPVATGIVDGNIPIDIGSRPWQAGDHGPVENLWVNSPSYRFALATGAFLMKPARFVEQCWDPLNIGYVGEQWVNIDTFHRPRNSEIYVHGEVVDGKALNVVGISQWVADYMLANGQTSVALGEAIRALDVRLIHQMAGFVSDDDIKVVSDNFGLLPAEDISIVTYSSPATSTETYSGVILEWTGRSWRAIGYDARHPVFNVIPPDANGPKGIISLASASEPSIVPWRPNTYYPVNLLVSFENSVWQATRSHTSGPKFEQTFWTSRPDLNTSMIRAPRVVTYSRGLDQVTQVPYGAEFFNYQDVADFLLGYERWLVSRGWIFDTTDPQTGSLRNWSLSVHEFLTWAQIQWSPGNFIALSPGMQGLKFSTDTGMILNVEDNNTGFYGLLDRSGAPIGERSAIFNRLDGQISFSAREADIFAARLELASVEHALIFSNVTIFDDVVYLPLFDMRQTRLRLLCNRSRDWAGRLDAPGFVILGNQLQSNFEKAAEDVRLMFDIELADRENLRDYARHVIGFQKRNYLDDLLLSDVEQFEFYQGMIQEKGAPSVFQKLMRSNRASSNSNLQFLEEWAIRIDQFGAPVDPFITFHLNQGDIRNDPQLVRLTSGSGPLEWITLGNGDARWVDVPKTSSFFTSFNKDAPTKVPTAGPVRLSDVAATAFYWSNLPDVYFTQLDHVVPFLPGTLAWVYDRGDGTFTVLRSFESGESANAILKIVTANEDETITTSRIFFQRPISLTTADIGNYLVIDGTSFASPELQGLQIITAVDTTNNTVDIEAIGLVGYDFAEKLGTAPFVRVLRPIRFATRTALLASPLEFDFGDLAWVDNDVDGGWSVLAWTGSSWAVVRSQPSRTNPLTISETVIYRQGSRIIDNQIVLNQPVVDDVIVVDPLAGLIAGLAEREIDFQTDYDPARYNAGTLGIAANPWGVNEIGRVWWNLDTVKFLDPFTDTMGVAADRDVAELSYRLQNWAHIAPGSSVDVYEWIESKVDPITYAAQTGTEAAYPGQVYNSVDPSWVEETRYDSILGRDVTFYYFWVKGLTTTPAVPFRRLDIASVATAIENPSTLDLAWMAPIASDTLIVSGVTQFLDDAATVMKVRLTIEEDNVGRHDEWLLMRQGDESSLPSGQIWSKLRDSLSGFDSNMKMLPDAALASVRQVGVGRGQNMFPIANADGARGGLLAARKSFIDLTNTILARTPVVIERNSQIDTLRRSTLRFHDGIAIDKNLVWVQDDASFVIEPPPVNEWDIQVFTLIERNHLLARADVLAAIDADTPLRVLINGLGGPQKQWSIWNLDIAAANAAISGNPALDPSVALLQNAETVFKLATAWDVVVDDIAERDALTSEIDDRVLVISGTMGFWEIWKYTGGTINNGYTMWRAQTYRTDDFFSLVDWYAAGYSSDNQPIVSYDSLTDRNLNEGSAPNNTFVRINDDGSGKWIWTAFDDSSKTWNIVAIQLGTLALSARFYDPTAPVYGVNALNPSQIANRDGSWELRSLVDSLRYGGILTDAEVNELFFGMLNFVHVNQDDVEWAFKTSFMTIVGYNVPLRTTPVLLSDQTSSLTSYIDEVKPYHVKVREFATQYNPDTDFAEITATDFDKPVYFDPVLKKLRVLDPIADAGILATGQWRDWYTVYQQSPNPVRKLHATLLYDRYSDVDSAGTWDTSIWDGNETWDNLILTDSDGAAQRILAYYRPRADMPPNDLNELLKLGFRADWLVANPNVAATRLIDGGPGEVDLLLNPPLPSRPGGLDLRDPYYASKHPEERLTFAADDGLHVIVISQAIAGQPSQIIKEFDVSTTSSNTVTVFFDLIAQAADAVMVFRDGVRLVLNTDYTVDHFARTATVTIVPGTTQRVSVHVFGFGSTGGIHDAYYLAFESNPLPVDHLLDQNDLAVVVDGARIPSLQYGTSGTTVVLNFTPEQDADVAIVAYTGGASHAVNIQREELTYNAGQQWALTLRDTATRPEHAGTIVEVNGVRLTPATTYYGEFTADSPAMFLPVMPDSTATVTVYVDDEQYLTPIPFCTTTDPSSPYPFHLVVPSGQTPPTNIDGQFVFLVGPNLLVALDPAFRSNNVAISIEFPATPPDYSVVNGVLTIHKSLSNTDAIVVTTFSNAAMMHTKTVTYPVGTGPYYVPLPYNKNYALITMNGLALVPDIDYRFIDNSLGWDSIAWENVPWDTAVGRMALEIFHETSGDIVATVFTGTPAHDQQEWMVNTDTPAFLRMPPLYDPVSGDRRLGLPTHGNTVFEPQPLFDVRLETVTRSSEFAGTLMIPFAPDDTTITVVPFLRTITPKLKPADPFTIPTKEQPGVVWIDGERIEYFSLDRDDDAIYLGQLRRGTSGTAIREQREMILATGDGDAHTYTLVGTGAIDVMVDGLPVYDFTSQTANSQTLVTLAAETGSDIRIATTTGYTYPVGEVVYNGLLRTTSVPPPTTTGRPTRVPPLAGLTATGTVGNLGAETSNNRSLPVLSGLTATGILGRALSADTKISVSRLTATGRVGSLSTTIGGGSIPSAVRNLTSGTPTTNSVPLSWNAPISGAAPITYSISYRASGTSTWTPFSGSGSPTTQSVLNLFNSIKGQHSISCQFVETNDGRSQSFPAIQGIFNTTGKWLGGIGIDYYHYNVPGNAITNDPNTLAIQYWNAGGLIILNTHMPNPTTGGGVADVSNLDAAGLLTTGTATNTALVNMLDQIAAGIQQLKNAGVIVIYRPYHENAGFWFWWGTGFRLTTAQFKALWRYTYNYLTTTKGLNNIVWAFTGTQDMTNYPGDDVVDAVGPDVYTDTPNTGQYPTAYQNFKTGAPSKPFMLAEFGFNSTGQDETKLINAIKSVGPNTVMWQQWWSGGDNAGIDVASNITAALNDPWVLNRGDFSLAGTAGPTTATNITVTGLTAGTSYDFRVIPQNTAGSGPASTLANISTASAGGGTSGGGTTGGGTTSGGTTGTRSQAARLLPSGALSTAGSQIVDAATGIPVRIVSCGWNEDYSNIPLAVSRMKAAGFNCVRFPWYNRTMSSDLAIADSIVSACASAGLKVILDNHANEGGAGSDGQYRCASQQANGIWYDVGGISDGTDGCGTTGTVTDAKFLSDWQAVATRYQGNNTVIGYDLRNEPQGYTGMCTWQAGSTNPNQNIRYMYERVGNAILAIDPAKLIICAGPQNYSSMYSGASGIAPWGDLSLAGSLPVNLSVANKLIYTVHDYPPDISGLSVSQSQAPDKIPLINAAWGYLVTNNIAPVWIGEMGSGLSTAADQQWANDLFAYMNGNFGAQGGPTFTGTQQGISGDWWNYGYLPWEAPQLGGILNADGSLNSAQLAAYSQMYPFI